MEEQDQYQKPTGKEGIEILKKMNDHHKDLTIWGLSNIPRVNAKMILDIGCGGGNALKMMSMKYPNAKCIGIDISKEAVDLTIENNAGFHKWGKIDAQVASVESIPFPEKTFDIVTAIETYFFWPDLERNIEHVVSRINDSGALCIVSEQYPTPENKEKLDEACKNYHMKLIDNETMKRILERNGLRVEMFLDEEKNWVTFVGTKNSK